MDFIDVLFDVLTDFHEIMVKLKSGHEIVPSSKEETDETKKLFPYYKNGFITLKPGRWFFLPPFVKYANRIYDFKVSLI